MMVAELSLKHQTEDREKYDSGIADLLATVRGCMALAFGITGNIENSQVLLTHMHRQLQALINTLHAATIKE
jgi:hypothetical protein